LIIWSDIQDSRLGPAISLIQGDSRPAWNDNQRGRVCVAFFRILNFSE